MTERWRDRRPGISLAVASAQWYSSRSNPKIIPVIATASIIHRIVKRGRGTGEVSDHSINAITPSIVQSFAETPAAIAWLIRSV